MCHELILIISKHLKFSRFLYPIWKLFVFSAVWLQIKTFFKYFTMKFKPYFTIKYISKCFDTCQLFVYISKHFDTYFTITFETQTILQNLLNTCMNSWSKKEHVNMSLLKYKCDWLCSNVGTYLFICLYYFILASFFWCMH